VLNSIAQRLNSSPWMRQLLFLASALLSIFFIGYHFGTFDQAIHIPFLKATVDPTLFPGDQFFSMRATHYSYFWYFFQPFYRLGILEIVMFLVHVMATHLTFWAVWKLAMTLFEDPLAALIAVFAFIFPHIGFAGFPIIEFSLLNRTFVLPFLLFALDLFLHRRYILAFLLLGALYNLHVISVNFVLAMVLFDCLLEFRKIGWRNIALGLVAFVIAALPVLIWKLSGSSPNDFSLRPEWLAIIAKGTIYNIFYVIAPYPHILLITACGVCGVGLFLAARKSLAPRPHDKTITIFIIAVFIVLAVQMITSSWLPITIIIQSQIIRVGLFGVIFGYLYFAAFLAQKYRDPGYVRFDFVLEMGAFAVSTLPIVPMAVWAFERYLPLPTVHVRRIATATGLIMAWIATIIITLSYQVWTPGIYIYAHQSPWYDAQIWARDNTPKNTLFITPPENWWFYESEWRVFSERSTVVTLSELLEAAFVPDYLNTWEPRFNALAPGALPQFEGDYFENVRITAAAFNSLTDDQLVEIARKYGASYLVVEKPIQRQFPVAYENSTYIIYDLRHALTPEGLAKPHPSRALKVALQK